MEKVTVGDCCLWGIELFSRYMHLKVKCLLITQMGNVTVKWSGRTSIIELQAIES